MIFQNYLIPDIFTESYANVTPQLLGGLGVRALICDIDNTLAPYESLDPPPDVLRWCREMQAHGIRIAFVSNNDAERVERFNRPLGYPAYAKAGKPSGKFIRQAMANLDADVTTTAVLGDQLFTDALAARLCGVTAIIVPPIRDKKTLFFRLKRRMERPYLNEYRRRHMFP